MSDCRQCADFDWCAKNEECGLFKPKPTTNYDRIRAMTDEELAEWLFGAWHQSWYTRQEWLGWLKQEVSTDG